MYERIGAIAALLATLYVVTAVANDDGSTFPEPGTGSRPPAELSAASAEPAAAALNEQPAPFVPVAAETEPPADVERKREPKPEREPEPAPEPEPTPEPEPGPIREPEPEPTPPG